MKKPVLFLIFNRPDTTQKVFEAIRAYRPQELFIAADGPRQDRAGEEQLCEKTREIALSVDWDCKVHTLFREKNLGCKYAVSGAINWFFEQVEEGIVLEDDCLPSPDFFRFCEEMLDRYRDEEKVMHIDGINFQDHIQRGNGSYYFSKITHIWGWASWRRAWKYYDVEMEDLPEYFRDRKYKDLFPDNKYIQWRFLLTFYRIWQNSPYFNTWDWQWNYAVIKNDALAILPNRNLVTNIGGSGTHNVISHLCNIPLEPLVEQLIHPQEIQVDPEADEYTARKVYMGSWKDRLRYAADRLHLTDTFSGVRKNGRERDQR